LIKTAVYTSDLGDSSDH